MLVKTLAISLLCLAVNAGVPSDRTELGEHLSRVFLCSCDTNGDKKIANSEIEGICKKVLMGFLGIGTEDLSEMGEMTKDDIIKEVQKREGKLFGKKSELHGNRT